MRLIVLVFWNLQIKQSCRNLTNHNITTLILVDSNILATLGDHTGRYRKAYYKCQAGLPRLQPFDFPVLRADALPEFFLLLHSANGKFCVSESHLLLNLVLNQAVDEDCPLGRRRGRKWPWSCCGGSHSSLSGLGHLQLPQTSSNLKPSQNILKANPFQPSWTCSSAMSQPTKTDRSFTSGRTCRDMSAKTSLHPCLGISTKDRCGCFRAPHAAWSFWCFDHWLEICKSNNPVGI